jgi:hypothetical protein
MGLCEMKFKNRNVVIGMLVLGWMAVAHGATYLDVAGYSSGDVEAFDASTGAYIKTLASVGGASFLSGTGHGNVWAASYSNQNIQLLNGSTGALIIQTPVTGGGQTEGAYVAPDGTLWASSLDASMVYHYSSTGTFINSFSTVQNTGMAIAPAGALDAGDLYVPGQNTNSVQVYDPVTGAHVNTIASGGQFGVNVPRDLVFGPDGNLYVLSNGTGAIEAFNGATGHYTGQFASVGGTDPRQMTFYQGNLYVEEVATNQVAEFSSSGTLITSHFLSGGHLNAADGMAFVTTSPVPELPVPLMLSAGMLVPLVTRRLRKRKTVPAFCI